MARIALIIASLFLGALIGCDSSSPTSSGSPDALVKVDQPDATDASGFDVLPAADRALPDDAVALDMPADQVVPVDVGADLIVVDAADASVCAAGFTRCGDTCVDTSNNITNCGGCGANCRTLPGVDIDRVTCARGTCVLADACLAGRGDCDRLTTNGCETDLTTPSACGRCGVSCSEPTPVCAMAAGDGGAVRVCMSGCTPMTPNRCAMTCVDTQSDLMNCGGCGRACAVPVGGRATCTAGVCASSCGTGTHLCDGRCVASDDPNTCGSRCTPCPTGPIGSSPTCAGGTCDFVCSVGLHRCGSTCISTMSISGCGTSCSPCPTATNADPTCDGMRCGFRCRTGFADCDGDPANGCEADLATPGTCGRCDTRCPSTMNGTASCTGGACGVICSAGFHRCGSACVSNSSIASCGSSCTPCTAPDRGTATCDGTHCDFACNTGLTRCGSTCLDTSSDIDNCGACYRRCFVQNATPVCTAGSCTHGTCNVGYDDCDGDPSNGCETNLWANESCGACGRACASGYSCLRGTCVATGSVCGRPYFTVECPLTLYVCTQHSTCPAGSGGICTCDLGYRSITCAGAPCSGRACPGSDFWCQPVP